MKTIFRVLAVVLVGLAFLVSPCRAEVYDDVAAWWHFDYDISSDNLVTGKTEILDQRYWGASGFHATQVRGSLEWSGAAGARPAGGQEYGGRSLLFTPDVDGAMNVLPDTFRVSHLSVTGSVSIVTRFRWDDFASDSYSAWIYNNAFNWTAGQGFLLGMNSASNLFLLYGQNGQSSGIKITPGTWYDVAMVLTDNGTADTVEFYVWEPGTNLVRTSFSRTWVSNKVAASGTLVGCETDPTVHSGGNAKKAFAGAINHMAVWRRALSFEEVNHAMGSPQHVFKIGVFNWNNNDMRLESQVDADYTIGEPWHEMRRAVKAGCTSARVHFTLTADEANLDCIFHLRTDGTQGAQASDISVYVNGQDLGTQTTGQNQDYYWNVYDDVLVAGANNLEIRYEAGPSAWLSFDWMELAGSWMLGVDNGTSGEFIHENSAVADFFVFNPNLKACRRAMTAAADEISLHFELSDELAAGYQFIYETKVVHQGPAGTPHPFDILVNGTTLQNVPASPNNTVVSQAFGSANLSGGDNVVTIRYQDTGGWASFDYHRLRVAAVPPDGTLFIVR